MAILRTTGGDTVWISRTNADVPSPTSYTMLGWFKLINPLTGSNYQSAMVHFATTTKSQLWGQPSWETPATAFTVRNDCGGTNDTGHWSGSPSTGVWYAMALVGNGSNNLGYLYTWNGSVLSDYTTNPASIVVGSPGTASQMSFLAVAGEASSNLDAKLCYPRVFSVAKSEADIKAELVSSVIVDTTNVYFALGACTDSSWASGSTATDISGKGHDFTLGAGLSSSMFDADVPSGLSGGGGGGGPSIMGRRIYILP